MRFAALVLVVIGCPALVLADESAKDEFLYCQGDARPLKDLLGCLRKEGHGKSVKALQEVPGAQVVRLHTTQDDEVYLLVQRTAGNWVVADHLLHEQSHGKSSAEFELVELTRLEVAGVVVWRVDYRTKSESVLSGEASLDSSREETALCAPERRRGCLHITTSCTADQDTDDGGSINDEYHAKFAVAPDGAVSVSVTSTKGSGKLCGR